MYDAIDLLENYRRTHGSLVTSRLHCYLPCRSIGIPVDFQPKNRSDPRFAGLIDITDAEFDRIRSTINDRVAEVMSLDPRRPARRRGLRPVAGDQRGRRRGRRGSPRGEPASSPRPGVALAAEVARLRETASTTEVDAEAVQVAVHANADQRTALQTLLRSIATHSSRPVHVHVVGRDLP